MSVAIPAKAGTRFPVIAWRFARYDELTPRELHDAFQLRSAVFVVEQSCPFLDIDGVDPACWHLLGSQEGKLVTYCRLVPPGLKYAEPSIGRVVSAKDARGTGAGRALMNEAVARAEALWPRMSLRIGDEDGILHIEMIREAR